MSETLFESHTWIARAVARRHAARVTAPWRPQVAEELEAVALEAVWRAAGEYDPGRGLTFPRFAARVARRRIADHLRRSLGRVGTRRQRAGAGAVPLDDVADPHAGALEDGTPEGFAHWNLFRPADREAVRLYYFGRLQMKEVGARLGVCEGQACRRISAALDHARKMATAARIEP